MRVLLLRHGETAGNREKRYVGCKTDEGLTEEAREKFIRAAEEKGAVLEKLVGPVEELYVSPMKRCLETAALVFPKNRFPGCRMLRVPELSECDFGSFEYKNYQELNGNTEYQRFLDSGGKDGFPEGEPVEGFKSRCVKAFGRIMAGELEKIMDKETIVFVVHGGTIMAVMEAFAKPARDYFSWQIKNGCGCLCEVVRDVKMPSGFYLSVIAEISVL